MLSVQIISQIKIPLILSNQLLLIVLHLQYLSEMTGDHFRVSVNTGDITGCSETKEVSLLYQPAKTFLTKRN